MRVFALVVFIAVGCGKSDVDGGNVVESVGYGKPAVELGTVVERGDVVTLICQSDGVKVERYARATQTARRGESIAVELLSGSATMEAEATGFLQVELRYVPPTAQPIAFPQRIRLSADGARIEGDIRVAPVVIRCGQTTLHVTRMIALQDAVGALDRCDVPGSDTATFVRELLAVGKVLPRDVSVIEAELMPLGETP